MNTVSIYNVETPDGIFHFNYDLVPGMVQKPIGDSALLSIGLIPVYEDGPFFQFIGNKRFLGLKVRRESKAEPKDSDISRRVAKQMAKDEVMGVETQVEALEEEIRMAILKNSKVVEKEFHMFYDMQECRFIVDANRNIAEEAIQLIRDLYSLPTKLLMVDAATTQATLTEWCQTGGSSLPEPFGLSEMVKMGGRAEAGKNPPAAHISISKISSSADQVVNHINTGDAFVHMLELGYDGVIKAKVDHTLMISGIKYEGVLKFKDNEDTMPSTNYLTQFELQLGDLSVMVSQLIEALVVPEPDAPGLFDEEV